MRILRLVALVCVLSGCAGQGINLASDLSSAVIGQTIATTTSSGAVIGQWSVIQGTVVSGTPSGNPLANAVVTVYGSPGNASTSPSVQVCASTTANAQGFYTVSLASCPVQGGFVWLSVNPANQSSLVPLSSYWTPAMNSQNVNITPLTTLLTSGVYGSSPVVGMQNLESDFQSQLQNQAGNASAAESTLWNQMIQLEQGMRVDLADAALSVLSYQNWLATDFFITPLTLNQQGLDALLSAAVVPLSSPVPNSLALLGTGLSGGNGQVLMSVEAQVTGPGVSGALVSIARGVAQSAFNQGQSSVSAPLMGLYTNMVYQWDYQDASGFTASCSHVIVQSNGTLQGSSCVQGGIATASLLSGQIVQGQATLTFPNLSLQGSMTAIGGSGTGHNLSQISGSWVIYP